MAQADEAWSRVDGAEDPDWVYWVTRDELDGMAGGCYAEQYRPLKAEPLLTSVLQRYNATHARERALYLTWLADTYLWAGEARRDPHPPHYARRLLRRGRTPVDCQDCRTAAVCDSPGADR